LAAYVTLKALLSVAYTAMSLALTMILKGWYADKKLTSREE